MTEIDRRRLATVHQAELETLRARASALARAVRARPRLTRERRADDVDGEVGRRSPGLCGDGARRDDRGRRRRRLRRLRAGRHRRDGGHSPPATVAAVQRRFGEQGGATLMLPTEDAAWVGEELGRRFGVALWSFALTATDANRWALRLCRAIAQRPYVLVFSHC
jgi:hypothetical protein